MSDFKNAEAVELDTRMGGVIINLKSDDHPGFSEWEDDGGNIKVDGDPLASLMDFFGIHHEYKFKTNPKTKKTMRVELGDETFSIFQVARRVFKCDEILARVVAPNHLEIKACYHGASPNEEEGAWCEQITHCGNFSVWWK